MQKLQGGGTPGIIDGMSAIQACCGNCQESERRHNTGETKGDNHTRSKGIPPEPRDREKGETREGF